MPMKLMVWVLPGVELTCASFCCSRELMRLDLPTLERPRKANSGGPAGGKRSGSAAEIRNLAWGFICCSYIPSEAREPYCLSRSLRCRPGSLFEEMYEDHEAFEMPTISVYQVPMIMQIVGIPRSRRRCSECRLNFP